jgi:prolyl-tRNA synthetase
MRWSNYYLPTLKEDPAEAEVISHRLLVRAGMIRKLTAGVYTYLPQGLRCLDKIARIVREEMNSAGALEVFMPSVQPADLWKESGRWDVYGKELLRFQDRHGRDGCLGPTHEEVITDLIRGEIKSYRQLPVNLYQIQTKFRDEIRPRFGLLRGREFIMKDAYSFDRNDAGADKSYQAMYDAYMRIFTRLGMVFRAVEADSGPIGGSFSHEFMVLARTGEDTIVVCTSCDYAANLEKAQVVIQGKSDGAKCLPMEQVSTPGRHTVQEVAAFLGVGPEKILKTLLYEASGQAVAALVRGDRELNEIKLKNLLGAKFLNLATPEQVRAWSGSPVGFAGPVGLNVNAIWADQELNLSPDWITGANQADAHWRHVDLGRDAKITGYADLRQVTPKDPCPRCSAALDLVKGIEVGHVFKLGTKYSEAMGAKYLDEGGTSRPIIMGCYGIGVSRIMAACLEQNSDEQGALFPPSIAPFQIELIVLNVKNQDILRQAKVLHDQLETMGFEVLLDDRDERPGVKFKDADLIGLPGQLILGEKGLARGVLEAKNRRTGQRSELTLKRLESQLRQWWQGILQDWDLRQFDL